MTNGIGSNTIASSLVVASQKDPKDVNIVFPFGKELKKGEWSFAMPKPGGDPENHMLYIADMGMRKVGASRSTRRPANSRWPSSSTTSPPGSSR